jgi:hypothetical protein
VKLDGEVKFGDGFPIACLWPDSNIPEFSVSQTGKSETGYVRVTNMLHENDKCPISKEALADFGQGLLDSQVCVANPWYIVPESCVSFLGASMTLDISRYDRYLTYVAGLSTVGKDCGFGHVTVATRISPYIDWIDSVILPRDTNDFIFSEDIQGECTHSDGSVGVCVTAEKCPGLVTENKKGKVTVHFCSLTDPISLCCPVGLSLQADKATKNEEIDDCPRVYRDVYGPLSDGQKTNPSIVRLLSISVFKNNKFIYIFLFFRE